MTENTTPPPKVMSKITHVVHLVTVRPVSLFLIGFLELILTLTMMKREPRWPWVTPVCALILAILALAGIISIYQNMLAYELTNRFSAYDLLSQEKPSPVAFSKTINELVAIEPVEDLTYTIETKGLVLEACNPVLEFFNFCEPSKLYGSTRKNEVIFDSISGGIVSTTAYSAPITQRNIVDSIASTHAVGSKVKLEDTSNAIVSLLGIRNTLSGEKIQDSTIIVRTEETPEWRDFANWYKGSTKTKETSLVQDFYSEILAGKNGSFVHEDSSFNLRDAMLLPEHQRNEHGVTGGLILINNFFPFIRNKEAKKSSLFEIEHARDIEASVANFNHDLCAMHFLVCYSDSTKLKKLSKIELSNVQNSHIVLYGEIHGYIKNLVSSSISISGNTLGYPIQIQALSGDINFVQYQDNFLQHFPSLSILNGRIYDNADNHKRLHRLIDNGYPHIETRRLYNLKGQIRDLERASWLEKNRSSRQAFLKEGFSRLRTQNTRSVKNLNLDITESSDKDGKSTTKINFFNNVEDSIIKIQSDSVHFYGSVSRSIIALADGTDIDARFLDESIVHIQGSSDHICSKLESAKHRKIMIVNKKCPNLDGISEEELMAFLLSLKHSKIEKNEAAFYGVYRNPSRIGLSSSIDKNRIANLSKQFEKDKVSLSNLHSYITSNH